MLVQVQPHADVGQFGGLVEDDHLVVQGHVHVRQVPVVGGRLLERQLACKQGRPQGFRRCITETL